MKDVRHFRDNNSSLLREAINKCHSPYDPYDMILIQIGISSAGSLLLEFARKYQLYYAWSLPVACNVERQLIKSQTHTSEHTCVTRLYLWRHHSIVGDFQTTNSFTQMRACSKKFTTFISGVSSSKRQLLWTCLKHWRSTQGQKVLRTSYVSSV